MLSNSCHALTSASALGNFGNPMAPASREQEAREQGEGAMSCFTSACSSATSGFGRTDYDYTHSALGHSDHRSRIRHAGHTRVLHHINRRLGQHLLAPFRRH